MMWRALLFTWLYNTARIGGENKGHQMMSGMGWSAGAGLGAGGAGAVTPVAATKPEGAGLVGRCTLNR